LLWLRSFLFNLAMYATAISVGLVATPALFLPRGAAVWVISALSRLIVWLLGAIAGTHYEVRGKIPEGAVLVASKHQSMWDTIIMVAILKDPAIVLKRELLWIPYYGWFSQKTNMIAIDRSSGASALRRMIAQAKAALALNRPIVIFPEGTRARPARSSTTSPASRRSTGSSASPASPPPSIRGSSGHAARCCGSPAPSSLNSWSRSRPASTGMPSWRRWKPASKAPRQGFWPKPVTLWITDRPLPVDNGDKRNYIVASGI